MFVSSRKRRRVVIKCPESVAGKPMSLKSTKVSKLRKMATVVLMVVTKKKRRL